MELKLGRQLTVTKARLPSWILTQKWVHEQQQSSVDVATGWDFHETNQLTKALILAYQWEQENVGLLLYTVRYWGLSGPTLVTH